METMFMKGNEALAEGAIRAGCRLYFGYPITPSTEVIEYMAKHLPTRGGTFVQSESEVAAIYMVFGAAGSGERVMTASSGLGISLMQEGISYMAANELPAVLVDIMRTGPGLGGLGPTQGDYFQATKGGGHGDYHLIVLAPASVQEMVDLTAAAFDLADKYRNPVMILADAVLGQMMEPVTFDNITATTYEKPWATTGAKGRSRNLVTSYNLTNEKGEEKALYLEEKFQKITDELQWVETYRAEDAEYLFVAYGTSARVAKGVVDALREEGIPVGLVRPITLWPFPTAAFTPFLNRIRGYMVVEMSAGQMIEDVRLIVQGKAPVKLCHRQGGIVPAHDEVLDQFVREFIGGRVHS